MRMQLNAETLANQGDELFFIELDFKCLARNWRIPGGVERVIYFHMHRLPPRVRDAERCILPCLLQQDTNVELDPGSAAGKAGLQKSLRSEERRVGKECRSRW